MGISYKKCFLILLVINFSFILPNFRARIYALVREISRINTINDFRNNYFLVRTTSLSEEELKKLNKRLQRKRIYKVKKLSPSGRLNPKSSLVLYKDDSDSDK